MKYISADDLEIWNNEAKQHRDKLRHFYYSNTRVRCHRTYELQKRKFIDRLCSNERRSMCKQSQILQKSPFWSCVLVTEVCAMAPRLKVS